MAAKSSSARSRKAGNSRRLIVDQSRAATVQWLALAVLAVLAVLAGFVLFGGSSSVLGP